MKDWVLQGFLAGVAGWPLQFIFTMAVYLLHLTKFRYLDFAAILTFNHQPSNFFETVFSEIVVIFFLGFLGIVFSMLIRTINRSNFYFKGFLYGVGSWFFIYALVTLFKVKGIFEAVDSLTSLMNYLGGIIWGIGMVWALLLLNRKYGVKNE